MSPRLLLLLLLTFQASAAWRRHVLTGKDDWFDVPAPHSLAYFTRYPALRDESGDACYLCTDDEKLVSAMQSKVRSELKLVGTLAGFEVYDLFYRFQCEGCVDHKAILVRTGVDEYREIYHLEPTHADAFVGSSVINVGREQLLGTRYMDGGNKGAYSDDFFWFAKSGATWVDFDGVRKAARAVLPKGASLWGGGDDNSPKTIAAGVMQFWVIERNEPLCCGPAAVTVRFRIDRGRVVVKKATFDPKGRPAD